MDQASPVSTNPLLQASELPYQLPPFDLIGQAHYREAFARGMSQQRAEVAVIAGNPQPPGFENTIVALERSGELLDRAATVFFNLNASNSDAAMQALESELAPALQAHEDAVLLDPVLFARVDALYRERAALGLEAEQLQLLERYHTQFTRAGARLPESAKRRLRQLNEQLSTLTTVFRQNVLKATADGAVVVESRAELEGLSAAQIGAAARTAEARGLPGRWVIALQNTPASRCWPSWSTAACASASSMPRSSAAAAATTTTRASSGGWSDCARSGPPCWGTPATRPTSSRTSPPAIRRRCAACCSTCSPRPSPVRARMPATCSS